jgi:superfamily II DNA or RNA helicase
MVFGPPMRWLIEQGYLTDYRYICPPTDLQMLEDVGASGDWSTHQLREAVKAAPKIIGDVVTAYMRYGTGKLGVTFSTDVETAGEITWAFQRAGIPAECLTGKTDATYRREILARFKRREIMQIVAVDIISEGFDLPAIEVLNMARPTASLALYMQQFGRALRTIEGKDRAIIIDHAGNLIRHQGPPDRPRLWGLAREDKRSRRTSDADDYKVCSECTQPFERFRTKCPHCGFKPEPAQRGSPAHVDGDLFELAPEVLAQLRGERLQGEESIDAARSRMASAGWSPVVANTQLKRHAERLEAQPLLRSQMAFWGGAAKARGLADDEIQKLFYLSFGTTTEEAMTFHAKDANALAGRIQEALAC